MLLSINFLDAFDVLMRPNLMPVPKINSPNTAQDRQFVLLFEQFKVKFKKGSVDTLGIALDLLDLDLLDRFTMTHNLPLSLVSGKKRSCSRVVQNFYRQMILKQKSC